MSSGRYYGDHNYVHLDMPGGITQQLRFMPGVQLREISDLYPGSKARPMTPLEIKCYQDTQQHKSRRLRDPEC
jgi:hypothetical protein